MKECSQGAGNQPSGDPQDKDSFWLQLTPIGILRKLQRRINSSDLKYPRRFDSHALPADLSAACALRPRTKAYGAKKRIDEGVINAADEPCFRKQTGSD